jgi:hypothetical protein
LLYGCWQLQEPPFMREAIAAIVSDFHHYRAYSSPTQG